MYDYTSHKCVCVCVRALVWYLYTTDYIYLGNGAVPIIPSDCTNEPMSTYISVADASAARRLRRRGLLIIIIYNIIIGTHTIRPPRPCV